MKHIKLYEQFVQEKVDMEKLEFELKQAKKDNPDKDVSYFFINDGKNGYKIQIKDKKNKGSSNKPTLENISFRYKYNDNQDMEELVNKAAQEMGIMTDMIFFRSVDLPETVKEVVNSIIGTSNFKLDKVMRNRTDDGDTMVYVSYDEDSEQYTIFSNKEF